jgi:hypothetical protein
MRKLAWLQIVSLGAAAALVGCGDDDAAAVDPSTSAASSAVASSGSGGGGGGGGEGGAFEGPNVAFVTSELYAPEELGGLSGADAACNTLAGRAGLPGTYVAWLSDSSTDAATRIGAARGWLRTDDRPFADTLAQLAAGEHYYPLNHDENGDRVDPGMVATGSNPDGTGESGTDGDYCQNWSGANAEAGVVQGGTDLGGASWSSNGSIDIALLPCSEPAHLYCFGVDDNTPLEVEFPPTRIAFVTEASPSASLGIENFDAACADEADARGLTGSFLALVAADGASAASRFTIDRGMPWGRTDGVPLMDAPGDLVNDSLLAPINRLADGSLLEPYAYVTTGAPTPSTPGVPGVPDDEPNPEPGTCFDWSQPDFDSHYIMGFAHNSNAGWWDYGVTQRCNTYTRVYCLEE